MLAFGSYTRADAWASWRVLVPLMVGLAGLAVWLLLEATVVKHPTIPFSILSHKMSLLGYFLNFLHGLSAMAVGASYF